MTAEDKELLIRDLCARLPYGVKVGMGVEIDVNNPYTLLGINPTACGCAEIYVMRNGITCNGSLSVVKPFLRPMSSMTEKEESELYKMASSSLNDSYAIFDWLNKNYFAYRTIYNREENKWENMFDKGLALVAPKEMYKIG